MRGGGRRALRVRAKICGLTRSEDVRAAVAAGCWAVGFVLARSPRRVSPEELAVLAAVASPAVRVAVLVDPSEGLVRSALEAADMVQLHGSEPPDFCALFPGRIIKAFRVPDDLSEVPRYTGCIERVLLDGVVPGSGRPFDWSLLRGWTSPVPAILAGGLQPDNVAEAIRIVRPWGVDASSALESEPGRKDPDRIRAFLDAVRAS
ncbi:MAG: phosphoribosylanthranilate isomerase [Candidatus Eremiobacterota bacterium]